MEKEKGKNEERDGDEIRRMTKSNETSDITGGRRGATCGTAWT